MEMEGKIGSPAQPKRGEGVEWKDFGEGFDAMFALRQKKVRILTQISRICRGRTDNGSPLRHVWCKQFYHYDVIWWRANRGLLQGSAEGPEQEWTQLYNDDIISMDKWEYPWYAHDWLTAPRAVDPIAKTPSPAARVVQHPTGNCRPTNGLLETSIPRCSWRRGACPRRAACARRSDRAFLEKVFHSCC